MFVGMQWVMLRWVVDLLTSWKRRFVRHHIASIWNAIPLCIMWSIWRECNAHGVEDSEKTILKLKPLQLKTLYNWITTSGCFYFSNLLEFIDHFFLMISWCFLYTSCVHGLYPLCTTNEFCLLIK